MSASSVPIIDIGPWLEGTPEGRAEVAQEVDTALREIGFLLIVNHGIGQELRDEVRATSRRFFELPDHVKERYRAQVGDDPVTLIEAANRAYLTAYRDNARIIGIFEHVSMDNPRLHEAHKAQGAVFVERNGRAIRSLQAAGLVDPQLDPDVSALALGGMVSRMAWWAFVADYAVDFDHLVDTVTRLWVNALGIQRADGASDDRTPTG